VHIGQTDDISAFEPEVPDTLSLSCDHILNF
jgi:hypothetical protein